MILVIVSFGIKIIRQRNFSNPQQEQTSQAEEIKLGEVNLDKNFTFTATDSKGKESSEVDFRITKAEKTKEVLIQGRPANAKGDKAFLVLHIEIDNSETQPLYIAPVDMLRLIGEGDKKFAPDIHSKTVEIQPISTKITRVGFVIPQTQNEFKLLVGELEGDKSELEIKLP